MPKLPGLGQRDAVRALEKAGFIVIRQGRHIIMSDGTRTVQIPRHTAINAFTMGKIAKDAATRRNSFGRSCDWIGRDGGDCRMASKLILRA